MIMITIIMNMISKHTPDTIDAFVVPNTDTKITINIIMILKTIIILLHFQ